MKKQDKLFEQTGIEEMDIEPSIERLGLHDDVDYQAIVQEAEIKQMKYTQEKARE